MDSKKVYVVIPNWNGANRLKSCLDSLRRQTLKHQIVVVDNGSVDDSIAMVEQDFPDVHLILHKKNKGFSGGVNPGIKYAMQQGGKYVALLNNDAVAEKSWLKNLVSFLDKHPEAGIATSKICDAKKTHLDSTGDLYTVWGLPFPRGRGESYGNKYDKDNWVFGASGGASLYRLKMLEQIGFFDQDFFAYYEDVDLSFRAQLIFIILYIVFVKFLKLGTEIPHFPVYLLLGIVLWNFFNEMTVQSLGSIVGRGDLIRKIRIPRWIIVLSSSISALINLFLNLLVVVFFLFLNHVDLLKTTIILPLILLEIYTFALGISLFLSAAFVKYRDVGYIWEVILQAGFYLTPILYPLSRITNVNFQKLIMINPMAQAIQDARYSAVTHDPKVITAHRLFEGGWHMYIPFAIVVLVLVGGLIYFRKESKYFAENI